MPIIRIFVQIKFGCRKMSTIKLVIFLKNSTEVIFFLNFWQNHPKEPHWYQIVEFFRLFCLLLLCLFCGTKGNRKSTFHEWKFSSHISNNFPVFFIPMWERILFSENERELKEKLLLMLCIVTRHIQHREKREDENNDDDDDDAFYFNGLCTIQTEIFVLLDREKVKNRHRVLVVSLKRFW